MDGFDWSIEATIYFDPKRVPRGCPKRENTMRESIWDEGRERRGASKVSTVINIRSARSVESDHVRIRVSINRREQRIIHDRGDAVSGASGWKHVTSEPCHGIEDVVFEGEKKIHFQDSLCLLDAVTRPSVWDRDGSRDRAKRERQFLLSIEGKIL